MFFELSRISKNILNIIINPIRNKVIFIQSYNNEKLTPLKYYRVMKNIPHKFRNKNPQNIIKNKNLFLLTHKGFDAFFKLITILLLYKNLNITIICFHLIEVFFI